MKWADNIRKARQTAEAYRLAIVETSAYISDENVKALPTSTFREWQPGTAYNTFNEILVYNGEKCRVRQAHTSQANWLPDKTPALYMFFKTVSTGAGEIEEYQQRYADNPYMKGNKVLFEGKIYECILDNTAHSPKEYPPAWKLLSDSSGDGNGGTTVETPQVPEWKQPMGGDGNYPKGARVMFNGKVYESVFDGINVWSPSAAPSLWKVVQ